MALTGNKRRKIDHVSSGDEQDDSASFASFDDSKNPENGEEMSEDEMDDDHEMEDGSGSDEETSTKKEETPANSSVKPTKQQLAAQIGRQTGRTSAKDALASGASAFTSGTFKSNMFKLQVDELLENIRPKHGKREKAAEEALHALKKTIEQIPAKAPQDIEQAERSLTKEKIAIPFPDPRPPKDAKYKLEYAKPSNINVVGSHALQTSNRARDSAQLDMVIQMPASLFQDKDYLNHRFFYKRAYYIACLAAGLKKSHAKDFSIRFQEMHGNALNPMIAISPKQPSGNKADQKPALKWQINIVLAVAHDVFSAEKLALDKNCVRSAEAADGTAVNAPTPFYNSTLRSNMLVTPYLKLLHKAATSCSAFRDACLLGSSWLRQRGFGSNVATGGFGNFEWSALMAALLSGGGPGGKPILSGGYSSYQLLKATLQLLAIKDLSRQPFTIGTSTSVPKLQDGSPVLWDEDRHHNILYKMTPWSYKLLQSAAKATLSMLADQKFDAFESTFILRTDNTLMRFDISLQLDQATLARADPKNASDIQQALRKLYQTLQRGLGDRVTLINIRQPSSGSWDIGTARPNQFTKGNVTVGIVINSEHVNRTVDHGPSAENKAEAASFRKFWGEKAELRRFKDGSILESLIWSPSESGETVLEQVTRYLLQRHFTSAVEQSAEFAGDEFSRMVRNGTSNTPFEPLMEAYKKLERDLRDLEEVPLTIRQLMPADAQLRFASIDAPMAGRASQQSKPADVTMQFEGSNRWPDDLVAIQRTKIAFLLKFSELLEENVEGITTRVGLENEDTDVFNQGFLDVTYESGASFRLRIHHEREQSFLERQLKDKSIDPKTRELAALALAKYKCDSIKTPAHTQAIAQLCSRFPALSGTIRLTKKWFASHLLANHIAEEIIELLVARTFVQPWPWTAPSSIQTGFLRTLMWISRWDWRAEPLIVDLNANNGVGAGELKQADLQAITTRFEAWRKLDPSLNRVAVFAASSADPDGVSWSDGKPSKVAAGRLTALARAAIAAIETPNLAAFEPASLFISPLKDYDFVLHLSASATGRKRKASKSAPAFKNLELETLHDASLVGYDAVDSLLAELDALFGSAAVLFANPSDKPVIAGVWNPMTAPRGWKVNLAYSTVPVKGQGEGEVVAELNREGILAEMARLGGDLIAKVEVNRS
ncbi:hypothetical protein Q7P37_007313 [Cladosporium fusiforme]